ncbi:MAG TPA: hypothetical protein VE152_07420 [Acidimicrobiales bacterium]|nr:hypothetical protein [Acidimicrobiales bacterium]
MEGPRVIAAAKHPWVALPGSGPLTVMVGRAVASALVVASPLPDRSG